MLIKLWGLHKIVIFIVGMKVATHNIVINFLFIILDTLASILKLKSNYISMSMFLLFVNQLNPHQDCLSKTFFSP